MDITKGEWEVDPRLANYVICDGHTVCHTQGHNVIGDARLIAAAVNACKKVNPDNPMAVAESISDMYKALKWVSTMASHSESVRQVILMAIGALAKAKNK